MTWSIPTCGLCLVMMSVVGSSALAALWQAPATGQPFGATPFIEAQVLRLRSSDPQERDSAGTILAQQQTIDARYLPELVAAWEGGPEFHGYPPNVWLAEAVAAVPGDEAVGLLWSAHRRRPSVRINAALAKADEEKVRPLVLALIAECADPSTPAACSGLGELLYQLRAPMPDWAADPMAELMATTADASARRFAEDGLMQLRHPAGLSVLQRRMEQAQAAGVTDRFVITFLLHRAARYSEAAAPSAPTVARWLDARYPDLVRANAAQALGLIGDVRSAPALLEAAGDEDDWLMQYNLVEALGRIGALESRPLLERRAATYWHGGVRRNAARALSRLDGGPFALPGEPIAATERLMAEEEFLGRLGDVHANWSCSAVPEIRARSVQPGPDGTLAWPAEPSRLDVRPPDGILQALPVLARHGYGAEPVTVAHVLGLGRLVGTNHGEFGGALYYLPEQGPVRTLIDEPVQAGWRMGGKVFVAAGLAHGSSDAGWLYVVDPETLRVERNIRLPGVSGRFFVSPERIVILTTGNGDMAIREDGVVLGPDQLPDCGAVVAP